MKLSNQIRSKIAIVIVTAGSLALALSACSDSKQNASGALKRTQYCEYYREFDEKVATAKPKEQKALLEKITTAKDFPDTPKSLSKDFETIIDGYEKYLDGNYNVTEQDSYKKASVRIQRHAIDNCEILKSNSGSRI